VTFNDIHALHYNQFNNNSKNEVVFKPSDILDMNDNDSEDEILRKFKKRKNKSPLQSKKMKAVNNNVLSSINDNTP